MANSLAQTDFSPQFSLKSGFYPDSVLRIKLFSTQKDAKIYYTLDGSNPNRDSKLYEGDIEFGSNKVVKAVAYYQGKLSKTIVNTYIYDRGFDLPVVSISAHPDEFYSHEKGILVKGPNASAESPYFGANFWKKREFECHIEFFEPNGTLGFSQKCGIRTFGQYSMSMPQKSLALIARDEYGDNRFEYPIFPNKEIKEYKSFILRNSGSDCLSTHFRDIMMTTLVKPLGLDFQDNRPAIVFLNGEYYGILNLREKVTEHFISSNHELVDDQIDIIKMNNDAQEGNMKEYNKLIQFIESNTFESNDKIEELNKYMDIDNYINYHIAQVYFDNIDGGGNVRCWREKVDTARFRWILFDADFGFGLYSESAYKHNSLHDFTKKNKSWPYPAWSTLIIRKLLENDSVANLYRNRTNHYLNTIFHPKRVKEIIERSQSVIANEMKFHLERWDNSYEKWLKNVDRLVEFANQRPTYLRQHLNEKFGEKELIKIKIDNISNNGKIVIDGIEVTEDFEGVYYSDQELHLHGTEFLHNLFSGWNKDNKNRNYSFICRNDTILLPSFTEKILDKYHNLVKFNEVCFKDTLASDWIEISNTTSERVDISNWVFFLDVNNLYKIPEQSYIEPNSYVVLVRDSIDFARQYYVDSIHIIGDFKFNIDGKKQKLILYDNEYKIVDSVTFNIKKFKFKSGRYLELISEQLDNDNMKAWKSIKKATPGMINEDYKSKMKKVRLSHFSNYFLIGLFFVFIIMILIFVNVRKHRNSQTFPLDMS